MFGSGGSEVAERVARCAGLALYDNAVVDAVAERSGIPRAEVSAREERVPSLAERIASAMALGIARGDADGGRRRDAATAKSASST